MKKRKIIKKKEKWGNSFLVIDLDYRCVEYIEEVRFSRWGESVESETTLSLIRVENSLEG